MRTRALSVASSLILLSALSLPPAAAAQSQNLDDLLAQVTADVQANAKLGQVMVDKIFSFAELGFHEVETSAYITRILRENGFQVEQGISGMPTAWWATWGSGRPVIAFGSDIDGIPKASQKPGVAYHDPLVEGAPGHGEGHNSGQAVNILAAIALKKVMERERIPGTLVLWPGVAEELLASSSSATPGQRTNVPGSRSRSMTFLMASAARMFTAWPELCPSPCPGAPSIIGS
jgi:aminobenzoyl-glutamate utilization protein B